MGRKLIKENHRAKVPKQEVGISWLNGEAASCQDQVALDMVSFLAIQTSGKLAREPSHWIGSPSVAKPPTGWPEWPAGSLEHGQANVGTTGHLQSCNKPSAAECHFWTTGQLVQKLPGPLWPAWACQLSKGTLGMADS